MQQLHPLHLPYLFCVLSVDTRCTHTDIGYHREKKRNPEFSFRACHFEGTVLMRKVIHNTKPPFGGDVQSRNSSIHQTTNTKGRLTCTNEIPDSTRSLAQLSGRNVITFLHCSRTKRQQVGREKETPSSSHSPHHRFFSPVSRESVACVE